MNSSKIILAGGSGFLGRALVPQLVARGHEVIILTRHPERAIPGARTVAWDGRTLGPWTAELEGARAVINLAGKSVNCRYTATARREIDESRVASTLAVGDAIHRCLMPPEVWVQTGSLAIHGDAGEQPCEETAPAGQGIPAETCLKWEKALADSPTPRTRRVLLRISFVLSPREGALRMLERLTRCFLGGAIGGGRQYISWLHVEDMSRIFLRALDEAMMSGVYNATSPFPVSNAHFMRELRRALHRPWSPPLPAWLVPLGCWLLRTEPVLALTGRRGVPRRLLDAGFRFEHPELRAALADLYGQTIRHGGQRLAKLFAKNL